jgi:uncharacterized protein YdaU (DUF1376 family)
MSRPWMPLYISDYLGDTGHLTNAEHGSYLLLIMHYWQRGKLPNDDVRLASIAKASLQQWESMKPTISEFFDSDWRHARIDDELEKSRKAYEKRALAGKKGGLSARKKTSNDEAMLQQCSNNAEPTTTTTTNRGSSPSEQQNAARSPSDEVLIDLRRRLVDAFLKAGAAIPPDTGHAAVWLAQGYSPDLILAVIRSRLPKARDKGLRWFDGALAEAAATKAPAVSPDEELIELRNGFKMTAAKVKVALDIYRRDPKKWNDHWGLPPPQNPRLLKFCADRGIELPGVQH